jgi:hypothetical protein
LTGTGLPNGRHVVRIEFMFADAGETLTVSDVNAAMAVVRTTICPVAVA